MECPASAKRGGASARIRRAIAPILSSRMWLATVTGPNRHKAGITGAKIRGDDTRPGTSRIGIVSSMLGSGLGSFRVNRPQVGKRRLRPPRLLSNMQETACESTLSGFDARECDVYVMR